MLTSSGPRRSGFTLIELLVVVAIIALLMAILLPSLGTARRIAKTVKCAAQLRQISIAMNTYAQEYDNYIVGNAQSSGAFLLGTHVPPYSNDYCPTVCQTWDWTAPIAKQMNISFNDGPLKADRQSRFLQFSKQAAFLCPENDIIATSYSKAPFPVPSATMISYNTASLFQYRNGTGATCTDLPVGYANLGSYRPKLGLVGNPATKIFLADGARWSDDGVTAPDVNLGCWGSGDAANSGAIADGSSPGGQYAEYGPWCAFSRAYLRTNGLCYAMRHGNRQPGVSLSSYRFNAAFFDGHAETLDGQRGGHPALWSPSGAVIPAAEFTDEAKTAYGIGTGGFVSP